MHPCFGYSLKKAGYIVAILEIIFPSLTSIFYIMGLIAIQHPVDMAQIKEIQVNFRIPFVNLEESHTTVQEIVDALTTMFSIGLATSLVAVGFGIFLFIAVQKASPPKIKIWLIYEATMIALAGIYLLVMMFLGYSSTANAFTDFTSVLIHSYFCWILYSHRRKIKEDQVLDITPSIVQSKGKVDISFPL